MEKTLLIRNKNTVQIRRLPIACDTVDTTKEKYLQSKTAYQELFQVLLRFPDKQVAQRILDAINGKQKKLPLQTNLQICNRCKQQQDQKSYADATTQTSKKVSNSKANTSNGESNVVSVSDIPSLTLPVNGEKEQSNNLTKSENTRKRRRNRLFPQVVKKSQAQQVVQPTVLKKRKCETLQAEKSSDKKTDDSSKLESKRARSESVNTISDFLSNNEILEILTSSAIYETTEYINNLMAEEFVKARKIQPDGFIPIHSAIVVDDILALRRQIYVWKKFKTDLNELCTEDEEDCLQLAVAEKCSKEIVSILLENDLNPNTIDSQSNTIIHLAIINNADVKVLNMLVQKVDLETLLEFNDDGFTCLHLAVRLDSYILAETLLNAIDHRLFGTVLYNRQCKDSVEDFLKFYEMCCEELSSQPSTLNKMDQTFKQKLLDACEMRTGNTALFHSIKNGKKELIFLLLAHLANPLIENLSGQESKSFLSENCKVLNLSLKIEQIMENVNNILEQ